MLKWAFVIGVLVSSLIWPVQSATADDSTYDTYFITGYTCPPYCGSTSDGSQAIPGVAACPPYMAYGTVLEVEFDDGPLVITCHDRYAGYLSPRIDILWPTVRECYAHTGYYNVTVIG